MKKNLIDPVHPGNFAGTTPEFGRCADVQRIFGLRRGTLYNLNRSGKIQGCLIRVKGKTSGVRLWDMGSIGNFIRGQMKGQNP
jgi:hypothetical protein